MAPHEATQGPLEESGATRRFATGHAGIKERDAGARRCSHARTKWVIPGGRPPGAWRVVLVPSGLVGAFDGGLVTEVASDGAEGDLVVVDVVKDFFDPDQMGSLPDGQAVPAGLARR